jgi:hypothetical protein
VGSYRVCRPWDAPCGHRGVCESQIPAIRRVPSRTTMDAVDWPAFFGLFYNVRARPGTQADTAYCTGSRSTRHAALPPASRERAKRKAMDEGTTSIRSWITWLLKSERSGPGRAWGRALYFWG